MIRCAQNASQTSFWNITDIFAFGSRDCDWGSPISWEQVTVRWLVLEPHQSESVANSSNSFPQVSIDEIRIAVLYQRDLRIMEKDCRTTIAYSMLKNCVHTEPNIKFATVGRQGHKATSFVQLSESWKTNTSFPSAYCARSLWLIRMFRSKTWRRMTKPSTSTNVLKTVFGLWSVAMARLKSNIEQVSFHMYHTICATRTLYSTLHVIHLLFFVYLITPSPLLPHIPRKLALGLAMPQHDLHNVCHGWLTQAQLLSTCGKTCAEHSGPASTHKKWTWKTAGAGYTMNLVYRVLTFGVPFLAGTQSDLDCTQDYMG